MLFVFLQVIMKETNEERKEETNDYILRLGIRERTIKNNNIISESKVGYRLAKRNVSLYFCQ